ncbi:amino acid ABC transporter permease [Nocardioides sp. HDW12B]|uniref:amino acid ABC transporter permease n=1 Tax=Nocardioides sp. HDW12B TaxID=2714939 RepID=UPI00140CC620|nr:amino acid ABC transporter permease [Nocardioides sp. HDW12B]QIK66125.1 amino acid ABC transporter permease [Nocardioides sp. HDW12B]
MTSILFDAPGPKTRGRHRLYTLATVVMLLALAGLLVARLVEFDQFAYAKWEPFLTPSYIEAILVDGLLETLKMASLAIVFAVVFGLVFGVGKMSEHRWLRWPSWLIVEFFRAVPVLLLMIFIYFAYGVGDGFGSFWAVVFALTLYNGSVLAEVFRAGVNAVPPGQAEAAYAIGMRKTQVMTIVLLPQAVKIMLPALISQLVVALKDTSLGAYVVAPGLTFVGGSIQDEFRESRLQTWTVVAVIYIGVNLLLTALATWLQHRLVGEKSPLDTTAIPGMQSTNTGGGAGGGIV